MSTKLCTIESTRARGGLPRPISEGLYTPQLDLTAFYGGKADGPCLQITIKRQDSEYIELTGNDVEDLIKELTQWHRTRRLPAVATNVDGHDI